MNNKIQKKSIYRQGSARFRSYYLLSRAFSLIELLIVIAIIGILASLSVSKYRTYTMRAKFVNVMSSVNAIKQQAAICGSLNGSFQSCALGDSYIVSDVAPTQPAKKTQLIALSFIPYVKEINVWHEAGTTINMEAVASASFAVSGITNPKYTLVGTIQDDGSQVWKLASDSTCIQAGLCQP